MSGRQGAAGQAAFHDHARGTFAVEGNLLGPSAGQDRKVRAGQRGVEIGGGSRATLAFPWAGMELCDLIKPGTFLHRAIEIGVFRHLHIAHRLHKGAADRAGEALVAHLQGAV